MSFVRRKMKLGPKGLELIASFEGFRAEPYNDPVGYATIGFGHLIAPRGVTAADRKKWGRLTRKQGLALLRRDAARCEAAVNEYVKVKLTQDQFDALVSFAFNCGTGALRRSTLLRRLNAGSYSSVPVELRKWNRAGGREIHGLTVRRIAEGKLFLGTHAAPVKKRLGVTVKRRVYGDADCSPELLRRLNLVAKDLGLRIYIRFGKRTFAEQSALWRAFIARGRRAPLVARPGTSRHETGLAGDCYLVLRDGRMVNIGTIQSARAALRNRGLCLPVPGETWHVERGTTWRA